MRLRRPSEVEDANVYRGPFRPGKFPKGLLERVYSGFTLEELFDLADDIPDKRVFGAPGLYWDTEGYSQGDLIRASVGWPQWLPIPVTGEHGALPGLRINSDRAQEQGAKYYVTTGVIDDSLVHRPDWLRVSLICSPWQDWIDRTGVSIEEMARGTIAFVPHLNPGAKHTDAFVCEYADALLGLPTEYHPVVACLHKHDVRSGLAASLIELGLPVISAGNSSHPHYFYRWVELVRSFRYATSSEPGSDLVYFHQLGGTYFVYGPKLRFDGSIESNDRAVAQMTNLEALLYDNLADLRHRLFAYPPDEGLRTIQDAYLSLFLTAGSRLTPQQFRRLLVRALPSVSLAYWLKWTKHLWKWLKRGLRGR